MKPKNSRGERLTEWLLQADDDLLTEAYFIDNADLLKKQVSSERSNKDKKRDRITRCITTPLFRRGMAAAVCLFLSVGALFAVPALFQRDDPAIVPSDPTVINELEQNSHSQPPLQSGSRPHEESSRGDQPPTASEPEQGTQSQPPSNSSLPNEESSWSAQPPSSVGNPSSGNPSGGYPNSGTENPVKQLHIDSFDMLNYYAALRVLNESSDTPFSGLSASVQRRKGVSLLALEECNGTDEEISDDVSYETTEVPEMSEEPPIPPTHKEPQIYYYEIDPDQVFSLTNALFFQVELTDETGFLASKLGTGIVDVVITDAVFGDQLITLKNGDRYYSCLTNSMMGFSTHKYIEGFYVVKNFIQKNYQINVGSDQIECVEWNWEYTESEDDKPADGILPIVSEIRVSNEHFEFTVAELEGYFNSGMTH